jgi:hypothetical protein
MLQDFDACAAVQQAQTQVNLNDVDYLPLVAEKNEIRLIRVLPRRHEQSRQNDTSESRPAKLGKESFSLSCMDVRCL